MAGQTAPLEIDPQQSKINSRNHLFTINPRWNVSTPACEFRRRPCLIVLHQLLCISQATTSRCSLYLIDRFLPDYSARMTYCLELDWAGMRGILLELDSPAEFFRQSALYLRKRSREAGSSAPDG